MTTDLDERIRSTLRVWADEVPERVGDPRAILAGTPGRRAATWRWIAAAALAAAAVALVLVAVRTMIGDDTDDTPWTDVSTEPNLGDPPIVVYDPVEAGWQVSGIVLLVDPPDPTYVEYRFAHDDGRRLELSLYPIGSRDATSELPQSSTVTVRGRPGKDTTYDDGRFRIDWDEAGRTWEATGYGFASLAALAGSLDGFAMTDRTTWLAWLPDEVARYVEANPTAGFTWNTTDGLGPRDVPTCPPPASVDAEDGPSEWDNPSVQTELRAPTQLEQVAEDLFPGYALDGSNVVAESAKCRLRRVELSDGTPRGFARLDVSDVLGLQSAEPLRSTGVYRWENEGVFGVAVLTSQGREAGVTVGLADPATQSRVQAPAFLEQLRAAVEALGY